MQANQRRSGLASVVSDETSQASHLPEGYPAELERDVTGESGARYHLRPIRPDDAAALAAFHRSLSPHSVYLRFFSFHPTLSQAEVEHFTRVDYHDRLALVVTVGDDLVAVGRFDRLPDGTDAEVAFVVADEYQHHGLGTLLLDELAGAARQRGVTTFRAETLAQNTTMLDVFRHSGYAVTSHVERGTVSLRFPIALTHTVRAALVAHEEGRRVAPGGGW